MRPGSFELRGLTTRRSRPSPPPTRSGAACEHRVVKLGQAFGGGGSGACGTGDGASARTCITTFASGAPDAMDILGATIPDTEQVDMDSQHRDCGGWTGILECEIGTTPALPPITVCADMPAPASRTAAAAAAA
jgi:hypothetical protein